MYNAVLVIHKLIICCVDNISRYYSDSLFFSVHCSQQLLTVPQLQSSVGYVSHCYNPELYCDGIAVMCVLAMAEHALYHCCNYLITSFESTFNALLALISPQC